MGSQRVGHDWVTEHQQQSSCWDQCLSGPSWGFNAGIWGTATLPWRRCFSVAKSCPTLWLHGLQHARLPHPSPSPRACSNSCPLSQWCHPNISSSVVPFFSCHQSFTALGSFLMNWLYASSGQSIGASDSASVLPMNIQDWFPLGWTGWISLQSQGLSRVFSNTTVRKNQFFSAQPSLLSNSHILLEKP